MRKLAYIISGVIFLAIIVIFILPFTMGFLIKGQYQDLIKHISPNPDVKLKLIQFDRGWFSSHARVKITFGAKTAKQARYKGTLKPSISFIVKEHILHGPFILGKTKAGDTKLFFARALIQNDVKKTNITFQSTTLWTWGNELKSKFYAKDVNVTNQVMQLILKELKGSVIYNLSNNKVNINVSLNSGEFNIKNPRTPTTSTMSISMKNIQSSSDYKQDGVLWYGKRSLSIDNITVNTFDNKKIVLTGIHANANQNRKDEKTNIVLSYDTKSLNGAGLNIGPIVFNMSFNGLNTKALKAFVTQAAQTNKNGATKRQEFTKLYNPLMQLLAKGLEVNVNKFNIKTDKGPVDFKAQLIIPPGASPSIQFLTKNAKMEANLQVPRAWLTQQVTSFYEKRKLKSPHTMNSQLSPQQLAQQHVEYWIKNEKLIESGNMLKMHIVYKDGKFLINGKPPTYNPYPHKPMTQQPHMQQHQNNLQNMQQQPPHNNNMQQPPQHNMQQPQHNSQQQPQQGMQNQPPSQFQQHNNQQNDGRPMDFR